MTLLGMIRHGRTEWNEEGRMTGRADIALTNEGRAALVGLGAPDELVGATWHISPLIRARQSAEILIEGAEKNASSVNGPFRIEPRLIEMDFGLYEGRTLDELRGDPSARMAENEIRGLDFLPPFGESPRMVQKRLLPFLEKIGEAGGLHIGVAHKSVIRVIFALAYEWNMLGRPPVKLQWDAVHIFRLNNVGNVTPWRMNVPLQSQSEIEARKNSP